MKIFKTYASTTMLNKACIWITDSNQLMGEIT